MARLSLAKNGKQKPPARWRGGFVLDPIEIKDWF
jgi:hypothetical protein